MTERNEKIVTAAIVVAAAAAAALCVVLTFVALRVDTAIFETSANVNAVLTHARSVEDATLERVKQLQAPIAGAAEVERKAGAVEDAALERVNELQALEAHAVPVEDAALERVKELQAPIAETHSLLFDARASVAEMNHAALAERKYFEVQIPETTARLNAAIDGLQPVEENASKLLGSAAAIGEDGRKVADKETADFLKPVPWYLVPVKRFGEVWDIVAAVARHTP